MKQTIVVTGAAGYIGGLLGCKHKNLVLV